MSFENPSSPPANEDTSASPRRGRRWLFVTTIAVAAALTGAAASRAVSHQPWHGPGMFAGTFDPARVEDGADRAIRHLAVEVDATPDQQEKLRAIVRDMVKDLLPMRDKSLSARQRGRVLLTEPGIDRAAIEALRVEQMGLADAASKRFARALGDVAEVLTPEQRRKIDQRLSEWRERRAFWQGWRRG